MAIVALICILVISTIADVNANSVMCSGHKKFLIPKSVSDVSMCKMENIAEPFYGTLVPDSVDDTKPLLLLGNLINLMYLVGSPHRYAVYEVENQQTLPKVCGKHLGSMCTRRAQIKKIAFFQYHINNDKKMFLIRLYFATKDNSRDIVIELPVFEANNGEQINDKLDSYLKELAPQKEATKQTIEWISGAVQSQIKQFRRDLKEEKKDEIFYFANCLYVSSNTLQDFAKRYGWIKN